MTVQPTTPGDAWAGDFGNAYTSRTLNLGEELAYENAGLWKELLAAIPAPVNSVLEVGCNRGMNLGALRALLPTAQIDGVEINEGAAKLAERWGSVIYNTPAQKFQNQRLYELVFTRGVLIHIHPDDLPGVYKRMYDASSRYIIVSEYYNPVPVEVTYRGNQGMLWKRDFAGDMMDMFPNLKLLNYGFHYRRDPRYTLQDDQTWFLLEKRAGK